VAPPDPSDTPPSAPPCVYSVLLLSSSAWPAVHQRSWLVNLSTRRSPDSPTGAVQIDSCPPQHARTSHMAVPRSSVEVSNIVASRSKNRALALTPGRAGGRPAGGSEWPVPCT
jgi:hypothetical protein